MKYAKPNTTSVHWNVHIFEIQCTDSSASNSSTTVSLLEEVKIELHITTHALNKSKLLPLSIDQAHHNCKHYFKERKKKFGKLQENEH